MRWYERLYVGEKAKKKRFRLVQAVRKRKRTGYYVLTPSSNERNVLDLIPALAFSQEYYQKGDYLILGLAADFADAAELAGRIVSEVYEKTGGYDVRRYLCEPEPRGDR